MSARAFLRVLALAVLVFGAAWLVAVLYWRARAVEVTAGQLVGWLLVLPLLLFAALLALRAMLRRRRARNVAQGGQAVAGGETAACDPVHPPDRPLYLHAAAVRTRAGLDPAAVVATLAQPVRPPLHPGLRDSMGLPVFAAAVDEADPERMAGVLAGTAAGMPPRVLRALSLLDAVAEELFLAAQSLQATASAAIVHDALERQRLHPHALHHSRSAQAPGAAPAAPPLQVRLLLPADWPATARAAAAARLAEVARITGMAEDGFTVVPHASRDGGEAWRELERIAGADGERDAPHLLLAADSMLDPVVVDRLEAGHQLLVSGHLEGRVPGEAAAGLLLASSPATRVENEEPVRVHRAARGKAAVGRAAAAGSARLLRDALDIAALERGAATVFTDADHRPSRAVEAAGAINGALPDGEPGSVARHLGLSCGDIGLAAPMVLLAAAAAQVRATDHPSLVLGLAGGDERIALAVSPLPSPAFEPGPADAPGPNATATSAAATAATA